jgi:hypothetical protein
MLQLDSRGRCSGVALFDCDVDKEGSCDAEFLLNGVGFQWMKNGSGFDRWSLAKVKLLQCRVSRRTFNGTEMHRTCLVWRFSAALWQAGLEGRERLGE